MPPAKRRAFTEIAAVLLTGGLFLVFENVLHQKLAFLVPCVVLWVAYIVWRLIRDRRLLHEWGMRWAQVKPALPACGVCFTVVAAGITLYRLLAGWQPLPREALWIFLLYPAWGLVQQFVVQALLAVNIQKLGARPLVVVLLTALLFGVAHAPDWLLAALCAAAGLLWTPLFLRYRSLYPIAASHAWLGALVYYWVLERNPWLEVFPPG
jgi:membrane protease YdiL (CAAX protease family)